MRRLAIVTLVVVLTTTVLGVAWAATHTGKKEGLERDRDVRKITQQLFEKQHHDRFGNVSLRELLGGIRQYRRLAVTTTWRVGHARGSELRSPAGSLSRASGSAAAPAPAANPITGSQWTQIGPAPLQIDPGGGSCDGGALNCNNDYQGVGPDSGMVTDIAVDPRNTTDRTIYIAANDGGVWKSNDGGSTWTPRTDDQVSLSIGALALDPANPSIVYAGTGAQPVATNGFVKGAGILKSTDGGQTWSTVGASVFTGLRINRMVMPAANVLLVGSSSGLYRSVDGGVNFGNNSPNFDNGQPVLGSGALISDLHLDTANSNTVYSAVSNQGLFRSTDGGATFPTNLFSNTGGPTGTLNYISFAQSTNPNNQEIVASIQGGTYQLIRSTNGGTSWSGPSATASTAAGQNNGCQCGYDQTVGIDPQDANQVYIGFQELYQSSDGGQAFNTTPVTHGQTHWDHHAITFSPSSHWGGGGAPTTMYVGEDGGFARSTDGGANWTNLNAGIGTNLLRAIDIGRGSSANNADTYGGMQDTGTSERRAGFSGNDWHLGIDGDGGAVAVDPSNPQRAYGQDDGGYIITTNGGNTWDFSTPHGLPSAFRFAIDPNTPANVFATTATGNGFNPAAVLYESTDSGNNYTSIHTFPSAVWAVANTAADSNTMWVGLNNGTVQYATNLLSGSSSTWTSVSIPGAPAGQFVSGIAIDPTNTSRVVVTYTGFFGNNPTNLRTKHVFLTTDGGTSWADISGTDGGTQNLPDLPVNSVVMDPGTTPPSIIVADDAGVLRSVDNGGTWQRLGVGLPLVDATWLAMDTSATPPVLRVGTYGRSAFELTPATGPALAVNADLAFDRVPVGRRATRVAQLFNVGTSDLHVVSFTRTSGSPEFSIISGPPTPVTIAPGEEIDYTVQFAPTSRGDKTATFTVQSDDPNSPSTQIPASGTGVTGEIELSGDLNFGTVARGTTATRPVVVHNVGEGFLTVSSVTMSGDSSFSVEPTPSTPLVIQPGETATFHVRFSPPANSGPGTLTGTLHVLSDDPDAADSTLPASGIVGVPVTGVSSSALHFGGVPVDNRTSPHFADRVVTITNQASCAGCDVHVTSLPITGPNAADFSVVAPPSLPATIGSGNHLDLTVRFNPSDEGPRSATLTVNSDDPVSPSIGVLLEGTGLVPGITTPDSTVVFGPTVFDPACSGLCGKVFNEAYTNNGQAELIVDSIAFAGSPAFSGPGATSPPSRFATNSGSVEPITFHPTGGSARALTGTMTITDNMGAAPTAPPVSRTVNLCGESVGRGVRVLAVHPNGAPYASLKSLKLISHGFHTNININLKNLSLTTIDPPTSCQRIQFQYENQNLASTDKAGNQGAYYTLTVTAGNQAQTTSFTLAVNEFKVIVLTVP
ncbi:MAG: choice-of-anchor D domain-containing protein [Actinomycetota bacterium]